MNVYVLIIYMNLIGQGGPTLIDNIESKVECERVRAVVVDNLRVSRSNTLCLEVRKIN